MNTIIKIIVIILIIIIIGYFIVDYKKNNSLSVKEYINNNLDSIFFSLGLLFSIFGLILMISNLIEFICGLVKEEVDVSDGFAILVFGVPLFSMAGSIHQTRKNNEEAAQLKEDINKNFKAISEKIDLLNPSNEDLHGEIEKLKQENQRILNLLEDKNQKEVCILSKIVKKIKK